MKIKILVELFTLSVMVQYAEYCGWALARAHTRVGQPALIAGYRLRDCLCSSRTSATINALVRVARQGRIEGYTES